MTFRELKKQDIELMLAIQKAHFPDGWNREQLLSGFNDNLLSAICLDVDKKVVGFISYSLTVDVADIEGVVVRSEERKKGYGKLLLQHLLSTLKGVAEKVFLEVRESNVPAIALYKSCGFSEISVRKKYYSDGENALVLVKEL